MQSRRWKLSMPPWQIHPDPMGENRADWTTYRKSKEKLNAYFLPKQLNDFALFKLMRTKPQNGESVVNYAAKATKDSLKSAI